MLTNFQNYCNLIDWLIKVLHPTWQKIGHFGDNLLSQSLGQVLKNYVKYNKKQICINNGGKKRQNVLLTLTATWRGWVTHCFSRSFSSRWADWKLLSAEVNSFIRRSLCTRRWRYDTITTDAVPCAITPKYYRKCTNNYLNHLLKSPDMLITILWFYTV